MYGTPIVYTKKEQGELVVFLNEVSNQFVVVVQWSCGKAHKYFDNLYDASKVYRKIVKDIIMGCNIFENKRLNQFIWSKYSEIPQLQNRRREHV